MNLTRRDAIVALAASGVAVGGGSAIFLSLEDAPQEATENDAEQIITHDALRTLIAAAKVLYPSEVENIDTFVTRYVSGRATDNPAHANGIMAALEYLNDYTVAWFDEEFAALDRQGRVDALHRMNADTADPDPEGSDVERVRYYIVNELLFALYSTPTGGELLGLENPQGHPGGLDSYQRGPQS